MQITKQVELRLFFNLSNRTFYVMLDDQLFPVRDMIVTALQEKHGLEIVHVNGIKEMQLLALNKEQ